MNKSAAAWKRSDTVVLPSGLEAELVMPDVSRLVMESTDGQIPTGLKNEVLLSIRKGQQGKEHVIDWQPTEDDLPALSRFMCMVVRAAFAWPRIVPDGVHPNYDAGEISMNDVRPKDFQFVFKRSMPEEAAPAQRFREGLDGDVGAASAVQTVQPAPKRGLRNRK